MNKTAIMLAGVIGISACALAGDKDSTDYAGKPADLSKQAEKELGGENLLFVVAVRQDGSLRFFKPQEVEARDLDFPIKAAKDINIVPVAFFTFKKNPHCGGSAGGGTAWAYCPRH